MWCDHDISAGAERDQEVIKHLDEAQIILLLISPYSISSNYDYDMVMKRTMERYKRREVQVVPIILRPVHWQHAPFGILQALPKKAKPVTRWSNQDEAFLNVTEGIRTIVNNLDRPQKVEAANLDTCSDKNRNSQVLLLHIRPKSEFDCQANTSRNTYSEGRRSGSGRFKCS